MIPKTKIKFTGNGYEFIAFDKLVKLNLKYEVINKEEFTREELLLIPWAIVWIEELHIHIECGVPGGELKRGIFFIQIFFLVLNLLDWSDDQLFH